MRTLVVGDVHGCADELQSLVLNASPTTVVLVGDLFTKGPAPERVWAMIRESRWRSVLGNHDVRLLKLRQGDTAAERCARRLNAADPSWRPWLKSLPLFLEVGGFTVVHAGLHPSGELRRTPRKMATLMRRVPFGTTDPQAPFWWQVYAGKRRVIYGHDALRGLVRQERDGELWTLGLDTGCVYGGELSGTIVETGELFQVPAARAYKAVA